MKRTIYYVLILSLILVTAGCSLPGSLSLNKFQSKSATPTAISPIKSTEPPAEKPDPTSSVTPFPSSTPTPVPTEIVFEIGQELTINYLRELEINSSEIVFHERLSPGYSYARHLVSYISEGNKIYGLLTIPFAEPPEGGFKAIVFNHGYIPPDVYQTTERYQAYVDYLARSGFVVFKIDYRGHGNSEGNPLGSYFSSGYTIDAITALKSLQTLDYIDPQGIGMWGHSMAGNLVLRAMLIEPEIKAGVIWSGAVYSYEDFLTYGINDHTYRPPAVPGELEQDEHLRGTRAIFEVYGWPDSVQPFWQAVSLTENIDYLANSIQIHHAEDDAVVNINYSYGLAGVLLENRKTYEFYPYDGGGHNLISPWFDQAMLRTVQFFQDNL
jgi:dipeptidyl aminopeptidase/acylaminoacyl peptidase